MNKIQYIWVNYITQSDSCLSRLAYNGNMSIVLAETLIEANTPEQYLHSCDSEFFKKNTVRIEISAQNLHTGKVLHTRIIEL